MRDERTRARTVPFLALFALLSLEAHAADATRRVAFTFDDFPGMYQSGGCDIAAYRRLNEQLVAAIRRNRIPALGLANEGKICTAKRDQLSSLYAIWADAGLELGNHTYSHIDFNRTAMKTFEADVVDGERVLRPFLAARGQKLRYFRFPFLRNGTDLSKKRAIERFLKNRGYEHAVVTIDNDDYIYAAVYATALASGDEQLARRIAGDFVRYMESIFEFYEKFSVEHFGYEPPQILLLHDHQLAADAMDELSAMLRRRGYSFISMNEALRDPIYRKPDNYTGARGLSWLLRWAPAEKRIASQPDVSPWIMDLFQRR